MLIKNSYRKKPSVYAGLRGYFYIGNTVTRVIRENHIYIQEKIFLSKVYINIFPLYMELKSGVTLLLVCENPVFMRV